MICASLKKIYNSTGYRKVYNVIKKKLALTFRMPEMKSQNGLPVMVPWVKSNSPGPSVVPAAKLKIYLWLVMLCYG